MRLDKLASTQPITININKYKCYRNIYNKLTVKAKKIYFDTQFLKHQANMKATCNLLRSAINIKTKKNLTYHFPPQRCNPQQCNRH